jgi:hypothetical protein
MTRELSEIALRHAVREKVFPDAQPSVLKAVELFSRFVEKHKWTGKSLSPRSYRVRGGAIRVEAIGRYCSALTKKEWIVALQPRQDSFPSAEQFRMWRSALYYEFCKNEDLVMIVDLSKNPVSQKRELHEITARKHALVNQSELDERLELVASCYNKAIEIVPERPRRETKKDDNEPSFTF